MTSRHIAQRCWQREGDQEVGTRQQAVGLLLEPGLGLVALAGRAMPVAAGPARRVDPPTGFTWVEHGSQFAAAARGDGLQHLLVPRASWSRTARDTHSRTAAPPRRHSAWVR